MAAGCAGPVAPDGYPAGPRGWDEFMAGAPSRDVQADWDDIDAAVAVAVSRVEMSVVARNSGPGWGGTGGDATRRVFELKTIRDEPAWLMITCGAPDAGGSEAGSSPRMTALSMRPIHDPGSAERLIIRARVGRYGDRSREQELLRQVSSRLGDLRGKAWCPADD